ncbi:MAG: sugar transferase [Anaerolineae bacterium]|nr:sugar transferase [Anaerolineae bacterium]
MNPTFQTLKRLLDIVMSTALLLLFSPLFAAIALVIKLTSPGPVFYRATRIGRDGETFKLYKFRSMVVDADRSGPGITTAGDARVTRIGRILRKTKLDELPQFINVLRGEMSLVGPRPEDPRYVALYTPEQRAVLRVRPGITSPASVYYRDEESLLVGEDWETRYIEEIMPAKLEIDLDYAHKGGISDDLTIMWRTFKLMWDPIIERRRVTA